MKHGLGTAIFSALALIGAKAPPPPPPVLAHAGPWDVHVSENACMLARAFGAGDQAVLVAFQPLFNASAGELFVMTHDTHSDQRSGEATIVMEPTGATEKARYFSVKLPKASKRVTRITVSRAVWDGLAGTDVLSVTAPPIAVRVKLVRFAAAKPVFEKCERDTLKGWGVDPIALDEAHMPTPIRSAESYFSSDDYPISAVMAGHVGRVVAILTVDAGGTVTGCRIGSSSWQDLNDVTCRQSKRVRFTPAHDAAGTAISGIYILPVRWAMPGA